MAGPQPHLRNAPIHEALIDFRVRPSEGVQLGVLAQFADQLAGDYPIKEELHSIRATLAIEPGSRVTQGIAQRPAGWVLRSGDKLHVVQVTLEGLTFSRLRPYPRWEEVWLECLRVWGVYVDIAQPAGLSRFATRFINRMPLPSGAGPEHFLTSPPAAPPIAGKIEAFFDRVQVAVEGTPNVVASITQAMEPATIVTPPILLLDIDTYQPTTLPPQTAEIGEIAQRLRELKNRIFFASITETAVEEFQ